MSLLFEVASSLPHTEYRTIDDIFAPLQPFTADQLLRKAGWPAQVQCQQTMAYLKINYKLKGDVSNQSQMLKALTKSLMTIKKGKK